MPVTKMWRNSDIKLLRRNKDNNRLIRLVTMATPLSSHVKDKNSIFKAVDEDMIF